MAMGSGLLLIAILFMIAFLGWPLIERGRFMALFSSDWNPHGQSYGILPMVMGSVRITVLALFFSLPMSISAACLAELLAPRPLRRLLLLAIRFMAGIPTVVYGFVAVFLLVPLMREYFIQGSGAGSADCADHDHLLCQRSAERTPVLLCCSGQSWRQADAEADLFAAATSLSNLPCRYRPWAWPGNG
jgi:phosphate transport system permease protein